MLARADADLARRDPALRGLGVVLDPDAFADLLRKSIPSLAVISVRPAYVRYKPSTRCLAAYDVRTVGGTVPIHANAYSADRVFHDEPLAGSVAHDEYDAGDIPVASGIVISVFPRDRVLRSLARIWQPTGVNPTLEKLLPDCPALWDAQLNVLAYKPGRRCVAALRGAGGSAAILKAYTASGFADAMSRGRAFGSNGPVRVARVLGRSRRHHLIAFEWLSGDTLSRLAVEGRTAVDCLTRVGAALADLHAQHARHLAGRGVAIGEELRAVATGIGWTCPQLGDRAARLARLLPAALHTREDVPLHGDFHAGQVLVAAERIGVVDMDRATRGDRRTDLASFIAHLQCDALEGRLEPGVAQAFGDALIAGYEESAQQSVRRGLEPYIAAALLRVAPHPFRTRQPDWPSLTAELVSRAEALVVQARRRWVGRTTASIVADPFGLLTDRALSLPPAALDPAAMARRLTSLAGTRAAAVAVQAIRVKRHKPGRRCLIEYDVHIAGKSDWEGIETVVAKFRAKGADTRAYGLSCALWRNGFRHDSPDGVSVPQPLGVLPELKMWAQVRVPGVPATALLIDGDGVKLGDRIARAIRKLHCHRGTEPPLHTIDGELRILGERLQAAAARRPASARRLREILECCTRLAGTLPPVEPQGIHRDFYPDQVLVDGSRIYLLDLDLYAAGDPALDIGNFLAHVTEYSLRSVGDAARLRSFESAMKHRALSLDPSVSGSAIEIYKTLTLARLIDISTVIPERGPFTEQIIEVVESRLAEHLASSLPVNDR